ncbi:MAG: SWIM zinc finger family protein [Acidobacteria bacterium]|nr:SWIM zinc finger family protein [Acidobacteriota bacterium]
MNGLEHVYAYREESAVGREAGGARLSLATSGGPSLHPHFFTGRLRAPRATADLLLALAEVVKSRYYIPPAMLHRMLREADPVVTCDGERLRFEVFSSCCSVYARVDLLSGALEGPRVGKGTTNVDFNPGLRAALARIRNEDAVALRVGREELQVERAGETATERKVSLPERWIRAFLEIQSYLSGLEREPRLRVSGIEGLRFFRSLPRGKLGASALKVVQEGGRLRCAQDRTAPGGRERGDASVPLTGGERLRILEPIAHHGRELQVYAGRGSRVSCWQLVAEEMRFQLVLSPEVSRGFSGEGQALEALMDDGARRLARAARALLGWQGRIDEAHLADRLGVAPAVARKVLSVLGTQGLVGFDAENGAFFHRELPFELGDVERFQPRLRQARKLVAEGKVKDLRSQAGTVEAYVESSAGEHRVRLPGGGDPGRCTCRWYARHRGDRGPCKHILALRLATQPSGVPGAPS